MSAVDRNAAPDGKSKDAKQTPGGLGKGDAKNEPKLELSYSELLDAVCDTYNAFIFWSQLTSLGLVVWYFPLWYMGISGFEIFIMATLAPVLLCTTDLRRIFASGGRFIHLASLTGILAYLIPSPPLRLVAVAFGVGSSCFIWASNFHSARADPIRLEALTIAWTTGLITSSIAKFANHTNNPVWPILNEANGGWNKTGFGLAVLSVFWSTRPSRVYRNVGTTPPKTSGVLIGLGFGALVFALHSLLSDSSTMILWVWEGFPANGPVAVHGVLVIGAMISGLLVGKQLTWFVRSALIPLGAALIVTSSHWVGFAGALILAFTLTGTAVELTYYAAQFNPAVTFGLGFFVYNLFTLAHVWVVAYAFVPGGPYLRERTDLVMGCMTVLILLGLAMIPSTRSYQRSPHNRHISLTEFDNPCWKLILNVLQAITVIVAFGRYFVGDIVPYHPEAKLMTAGVWTIHFSLDNDMWSSEYRMRDLMKELELDVVGLIETDNQRIIMGNRDPTQFLAEDLGMYVDYGPGPNKHTWGCALLSKFPILNSTHHLLPSPVGELAPAIHATVDAYGELVDVFVFHSGQEEDPEDRRLQSEYLADLMKDTPRPAILLSYLVTKPLVDNYNTYVGLRSSMNDIDPTDWDRWCEYILFKGMKRTGYARVSRSTITDTELQVGKFVIGEPENGNNRVIEEQVPHELRFPTLFRGEGVRGHRYHVFNEPRYFE